MWDAVELTFKSRICSKIDLLRELRMRDVGHLTSCTHYDALAVRVDDPVLARAQFSRDSTSSDRVCGEDLSLFERHVVVKR